MTIKSGETVSANDKIFSWARFFAPFIVGIVGALIGGFASFTITQQQVAYNAIAIEKHDKRIGVLEQEKLYNADRFARIEVKLDLLLEASRK